MYDNENDFKINPIFSNKPSFSPIVTKTVQGCNQIDLVDMRPMSIAKDGVEHNYILSLLGIVDIITFFHFLHSFIVGAVV